MTAGRCMFAGAKARYNLPGSLGRGSMIPKSGWPVFGKDHARRI